MKETNSEAAHALISRGWHPNLATGSITRQSDQRTGLVDAPVWSAMRELVARSKAAGDATLPLAPSPRGSARPRAG